MGYPLTSVFKEAFVLLGRHFTLVYPVYFYFLVLIMVIPQHAVMDNSWAWKVMGFGLVAIWFIFQAGWYAAMKPKVLAWLKTQHHRQVAEQFHNHDHFESNRTQAPTESSGPREWEEKTNKPFQFLIDFFWGVGQYGPMFLLAGMIWFAITVFLPMQASQWVCETVVGIPAFITKLQARTTPPSQAELETMVRAMSVADQVMVMKLGAVMFGFGFLTIILNTFFLYWPQFVLLQTTNPFKALWASIRYAVTHPGTSIVLNTVLVFTTIVLMAASVVSDIVAFFANLLLIISVVYFGLLTFLVVLHSDASLMKQPSE